MNKESELSIIITNHNNKDYLKLCLDSLIKHTKNLSKYEVIIIDDGSKDGSFRVIEEYLKKCKQVTGLRLPSPLGLGAASNVAVAYANSEWIMILNEDCVFPQDWEENFYLKYRKKGRLAGTNLIEPGIHIPVASGFDRFDCGTTVKDFNMDMFIKREKEIREDRDVKASNGPQLMHKEDYMRVGGCDVLYRGGIVVDTDFFIKWRLAGLDCVRTYGCAFYHFSGKGGRLAGDVTTTRPEFSETEQINLNRFQAKWGFIPFTDKNGLWTAPSKTIKGIDFSKLK